MLCISKTLLYLQESSGLVFAVHRSMGSMSVSEKYNKTTKYQVNQGQSWHVGSMEDPVLVYVTTPFIQFLPKEVTRKVLMDLLALVQMYFIFILNSYMHLIYTRRNHLYNYVSWNLFEIQCHWKELIFNIHHALNTRKNSAFIGQLHPCSILVFYYLITSFVFLCYPNYFRVLM